MILPVITIGWFEVAAIMRLVRSSMLDTMDSEYVKLARIKGVSEQKIIWKHCLPQRGHRSSDLLRSHRRRSDHPAR